MNPGKVYSFGLCGFSLSCTAPPMAPQYTCTFPGGGILRLTWTNVDAGDDVTMYLAGVCTSVGCTCVPDTECGGTTVCDRNPEEGESCFAAVNSCGQRSSASTVIVTSVNGRLTQLRIPDFRNDHCRSNLYCILPYSVEIFYQRNISYIFSSCCSCIQ